MNLAARIFDSGVAILAHRWHGLHSGNRAVLWKTATGSWCSRHYTASYNNVSLNYYMVTGGSHENHSFYRPGFSNIRTFNFADGHRAGKLHKAGSFSTITSQSSSRYLETNQQTNHPVFIFRKQLD